MKYIYNRNLELEFVKKEDVHQSWRYSRKGRTVIMIKDWVSNKPVFIVALFGLDGILERADSSYTYAFADDRFNLEKDYVRSME